MSKKTAKTAATSAPANAVVVTETAAMQAALAFTVFSANMLIRAAELQAVDVSAFSSDDRKKHVHAIKNHAERAARSSSFARLLGSESVAAVWNDSGLTEPRVNAMAIYAQDKVDDLLRALAAGVTLASVSRNAATAAVLRILATGKPQASNPLACDVSRMTGKPFSTGSTQTSSSLSALAAFGFVQRDMMTREHSLTEAGTLAAAILA